MMRKVLLVCVIALLLVAAFAYLRDPPWLSTHESGFRAWETAADGTRYRWTSGHASFFVSATATSMIIPVRTTFDPGDPPVQVVITLDDYEVARHMLQDSGWMTPVVRLPASGPRRVRRVDILVDRVRKGNRGVQVGEISLVR